MSRDNFNHEAGAALLDEAPEGLPLDEDFAIDEFLASEETKDLLRFSTAGSVDDGKSTLIGRLLYDSRNVYEDQVRAVTNTTLAAGQKKPTIDFAQLTDGLRAEREQGITIDVAYRYFSTKQRKFIIADTPGHEQYTRNMATGASTADLAIILIDARKGILTQSRRHAYIASLLGIRHLVAAVNKMDLVDFSEEVYRKIEQDFAALVRQYGAASLVTIPVSALDGDNVVEPSARTPWYSGPTLLEHLEQVPVGGYDLDKGFRLPVQRVIRPDQHFRGFAGQIAAGTIRRGDAILALPSGRASRVASITNFDGELKEASAPQSIVLTLEDELDVSRGDILSSPDRPPQSTTEMEASLVWFDSERLESHKPYLLKHGAQTLNSRITRVRYRTNIQTLEEEAVHTLGMNDIGVAEISTTRALFFDPYSENRSTGSFILIDPSTNATVAAGMIRRSLAGEQRPANSKQSALLLLPDADNASRLEEILLDEGIAVVRTRVVSQRVWQALLAVGVVVILEGIPAADGGAIAGETPLEVFDAARHTPQTFLRQLTERGVLTLEKGTPQ
jgi:sulfate adenylyltransferase large subunit